MYSLSVAADARGRGIGEKLLRQMLAEMEQRGVTRVYLEVDQANTAAIRLYERLGFHRVGLLPDYYGENRPALHMMYEAVSLRPVAA